MSLSTLDIDTEIDNLIIFNNQYNIANIIHKLLKDKYYYSNREWFIKQDNTLDAKANSLIYDIKEGIANRLIDRASHWEKFEQAQENQEQVLQSKYKATRILHLANKLKSNDRYVKELIAELKTFFNNE